MKVRGLLIGAALGLLFLVPPVFAQSKQAENQFETMMQNHPDAQRNPALLNDPHWLRKHPHVKKFMHNHPGIRNQEMGRGGFGEYGHNRNFAENRGPGDYDQHHQWHNQEWWYHNNPQWVQKNHPEWYKKHPNWDNGEGAWNKQHQWRSRHWWMENHRKEARSQHPDWFKDHHDHDHDNH